MKKLIEIQSALKAPKSQFNSFGKYKYRNCEDILEALKPLLAERGLLLTVSDNITSIQSRYDYKNVNQKGEVSEGSFTDVLYVTATATIEDIETKEQISVSAHAGIELSKKGMDLSQSFGASSSYARKYALNGLFLIDDTADADATNDHGVTDKKQPIAKQVVKSTIFKYRVDKLMEKQEFANWLTASGYEVDFQVLPNGDEIKFIASTEQIDALKAYLIK